MSKKITTEDFIVRAKTTHGDKYGYEKVHYTKMHDKVCIVCPKHGEFWQRAYHHVYGGGCPKCAGKEQLTTEEFISIANKRHNNFYGYKSTKYVNSKSKVIITCPKHGNFEQIASDHLAGSGCPKCACIGKLTTEEFIERSKKIHNNKYDYSKVKYKNSRTKVCIVCPEHGEFLQEPASHLRGNGCPECAKEMCGKSRIVNFEYYLMQFKEAHGDRYVYDSSEYVNSETKIKILCKKHGYFEQLPYEHAKGCGCPKCAKVISQSENEIFDFINKMCPDAEQGNRTILNGKELDIYIPSKKLAIEYNGLYWHSEACGKDVNYHLKKTEECENQSIWLIHIFEDEWLEQKSKVKCLLKKELGFVKDTIDAYQCKTTMIDNETAQKFIKQNTFQRTLVKTKAYGLYYRNKLVSLMSLKRSGSDGDYEILCFCNQLDIDVVNSFKVLLEVFNRDCNPRNIIYKIDRRWQQGNTLEELGFSFAENTKPYCFCVVGQQRKKIDINEAGNEAYNTIFDCGRKVYNLSCKTNK